MGGPGGSGGGLLLWGFFSLPTGPESPRRSGGADGEADEWGGSESHLPLAGAARQWHMAGDLLHNLSLSRMDEELGLPAE
jgi:hypothetical protein